MTTLLLNNDTWDLALDQGGRIAIATGPYAVAQNVANAVRLFTNDAYFAQQDGVPHFSVELGNMPPEAVLKAQLLRVARAVPHVASATVSFLRFEGRTLTGRIDIVTTTGEATSAQI